MRRTAVDDEGDNDDDDDRRETYIWKCSLISPISTSLVGRATVSHICSPVLLIRRGLCGNIIIDVWNGGSL